MTSNKTINSTDSHIDQQVQVITETMRESMQTDSKSTHWQLLCLSARTENALEQDSDNLADYLTTHPALNLADVAYTLLVDRKNFAHRRFVVCQDTLDAVDALKTRDPSRVRTASTERVSRPVVFMFSGMGEQYVNMAAGLYQQESVFRQQFNRCATILEPLLKIDIRKILYHDQKPNALTQTKKINLRKLIGRETEDSDDASQRLNQTKYAHPAMFAVEYALAQLWISWGILPHAMIGFSLGEYIAACLAGVLSLEDMLRAVVRRAELIDRLPGGVMLAVSLPGEEITELLGDALSLAAINTPSLCTVAGTESAIQKLEETLNEKTIISKRLRTTHAFHSMMMEPIKDEFIEFLKPLHFSPPQFRYISNVTGNLIQDDEATDPAYWGEHTCRTVRFSDGIDVLSGNSDALFLEVGPGQSLASFVLQHTCLGMTGITVLTSLRNRNEYQPDDAYLLNTLGNLWLAGVNLEPHLLYAGEQRLRIPLPISPSKGKKNWIAPQPLVSSKQVPVNAKPKSKSSHPALGVPYTPPESESETLIIGLWQELLEIESIGIHDHFFQLGGDSLLGIQLISRLKETFGVEVPLQALFSAPTVKTLSSVIEALRSSKGENSKSIKEIPDTLPLKKRLLLEKHLKGKVASSKPIDIIPQRPRTGPIPLSFEQQRLWFIDQLEEENAAYNIPMTLCITGPLRVELFNRCFQEIIQRHESLRTIFVSENGQPRQIINQKGQHVLFVNDLCELPNETRFQVAHKIIDDEFHKPFNLSKGPLFRYSLLKIGKEDYVLLLNMHHIISDAWSFGIFFKELTACYQAFSQGRLPNLPSLTVQYADYAVWKRQWLTGFIRETQMNYWQKQLKDLPLIELPTDKPRPPIATSRGASYTLKLPMKLARALKRFGNELDASLFMTLLAGFVALLSKYSGQDDIVLGSPITNRTRKEIEPLIGFFVNTLILRTDIAGNPTFKELQERVKKTALEAYTNQDIPFEQIVEELQPERDRSRNPLIQVLFTLRNAPMKYLRLPGLTLSTFYEGTVRVKMDLEFQLCENHEGISCDIFYNTDLFKEQTIDRMAAHYQNILADVMAEPEKRVLEISILSETEKQQLVDWNKTERDYPKACIHELFEKQVEKNPERVAVVYQDMSLTYWELNAKANQLAHYLMILGVKTEVLVGICVERSLEMVIGLLGILKAGGAYVPIDPNYPVMRIRYMLNDSAAPLLLTQSHLKTQLSLDELEHECVVVCLDEGIFANQSLENPQVNRFATDLAYVIYTSGSTGMPKGVAIEHSSPAQLINWANKIFDSAQLAGVLVSTSICFDLSIFELFVPLSHGGGVIVVEDALQLQKINQTLLPITLLNTVPSVATALLNAAAIPSSIQVINLAGEPLKNGLAQALYKTTSVQKIYNLYGPSEDTTYSTFTCVARDSTTEPTIGIPIANTRIYILNAQHQPQPPGIPGELSIAGAGLARGYLNRPELTAEKFIEVELFGKTERIYKTGDLARWLPDGNLEYQGRIDSQVKLRGFRIELGEIESVLATHPLVTESVVVVHEMESGDKRLVAFVVPSQGQVIDNQALRIFLTERLPDYMIPSTVVAKTSLPLTPNGKIDRQALSQLEGFSEQLSVATFIAPRDTVELQLTQIWETVLEVHPIGVRDNFFELGGHSLLAVRLMAQIEQQLNKPMPLATLFQGATIEQLAIRLRQSTDTETWSPLVPIQPKGDKTPLFCVHPGGGHVLCYFELAQHLGIDQPFYGLQAFGMEAGQQPKKTVEEMATGYLKALQTMQKQGPYQLVGWSFGGVVAFEMARQLQAQGESVSFLGLLDTVTPAWFADNPQELEANEAQLLVDLFAETNLALSVEQLQPLNLDEQLNDVIAQGQQANLFSPEVKPDHIKRLLDVYQANRKAFQRYQSQVYQGKLTVFSATDRQDQLSPESSLGWEKFTTKAVESYSVPGNHYNMVRSPNVQALAKQLKRCLEAISD